jgi:hypothetical protein
MRINARVLTIVLALVGMAAVQASEPEFVVTNARVIPLTRFLEDHPLDKSAPLTRKLLLDWEDKSTDVVDVVCPGVLSPVPGNVSYGPELTAQFVFGSAAYQLANPAEKGKLMPQQLAGMRSMLKAYGSIVAVQPDARIPRLDELARQEAAGNLSQVLEPLVALECKSSG